jgi:hypothetical protein
MHSRFWSENLKGRDHSEDLGVDEKIIVNGFLVNRVRSWGLGTARSG